MILRAPPNLTETESSESFLLQEKIFFLRALYPICSMDQTEKIFSVLQSASKRFSCFFCTPPKFLNVIQQSHPIKKLFETFLKLFFLSGFAHPTHPPEYLIIQNSMAEQEVTKAWSLRGRHDVHADVLSCASGSSRVSRDPAARRLFRRKTEIGRKRGRERERERERQR